MSEEDIRTKGGGGGDGDSGGGNGDGSGGGGNIKLGCVQRFSRSKFLGVYCAFLSSAGSPLHLLTAAMITDVSTPMILLVRSLEHFVVFAIFVVLTWKSVGDAWVREEVLANVGHALAAAASLFFVYYALAFLPSADVYVISCATPIFATLAAYVVLKEKFGAAQGVSAVVVAVGAVIITKPTWLFGKSHYKENAWIGTLLSIFSCVFTTIQALLVRKLQKTSTGIVIFVASIIFSALSLILLLWSMDFRYPSCTRGSTLLLLGGACQIVTNVLQVVAGKLVKAGRLSVIKTSAVLFTYVFQVILVGEIPTWHSLLGAALILVSVLLTTLKKCDFCDACPGGLGQIFGRLSRVRRPPPPHRDPRKYIQAPKTNPKEARCEEGLDDDTLV